MGNRMRLPALLLCLFLSACISIPTPAERTQSAEQLVASHGWKSQLLKTNEYDLVAFSPMPMPAGEILTVYIEGDGFAWISSSQPSSNPTPINHLALKLALADPLGDPVAYLGRPCQYVNNDKRCKQSAWTNRRFSRQMINASSQSIDQLKQQSGASRLRLVGFSGGGAVAALLAAQRNDVSMLITVAGNLDHKTWSKHHRLTPLRGSLNAADAWQDLQAIPQIHFVGGKDKSVPPMVANAYRSRFPSSSKPSIQLLPEFGHHCCWVNEWPRLARATIE
ncbi:alpha/beta hydrolase [Solemya velum gill symbiont]|uniref:alpha/beta hydrolase n=2 Tax=Solemya velum gill symbiont TaxID=2340 RepID=UPI001E3374BF|nr:alpha/beta hydrolase [Solemya velum gill symbiont]